MNTKQLEYFLTLCSTGNITTASEELFLTRQALSKSIQALEEEFGFELFKRTSNGVELTMAGSIIRDCAQQSELMWEHALERATKTISTKTIRFGAHLTHLTDEAIDFIMDFQAQRSDVRIVLYDYEDYSQLFKLLRNNTLDIVNARKHPEGEDMSWFSTMDCQMYLLANKNNPLVKKDSVDFMQDLKGCLAFILSHDTIAELTPYANKAGIVLEYMTPSYLALSVALKHDRGVFFAPSISAPMLADKTITARKIIGFPFATINYFAYSANPPKLISDCLEYMKGFSLLPVHQLDQDGINNYYKKKK